MLAFSIRIYHDGRSYECQNNLSGLLVKSDNQNHIYIGGSPAGHYAFILISRKKNLEIPKFDFCTLWDAARNECYVPFTREEEKFFSSKLTLRLITLLWSWMLKYKTGCQVLMTPKRPPHLTHCNPKSENLTPATAKSRTRIYPYALCYR